MGQFTYIGRETKMFKHIKFLLFIYISLTLFVAAPIQGNEAAKDLAEVLVYPVRDEGSIMQWLCISPLAYNAAYIGDSMSYDVFKIDARTELNVRPRAGDRVQEKVWHKMSFGGSTEGPTMCTLFDIAGYGFDYKITACMVYIYSPADHPNAIFSGSSDDALKVVLNGAKIWSNQIQRSPTYDGDQCPAPLKKGWNPLLCVIDQAIGGHLLTARFLDGDKPITDIEIALDPPAGAAIRHLASAYNGEAAQMIRDADALKSDRKWAEAIAAYDRVLAKYPLSDVAPRAAYARASTFYTPGKDTSLSKPEEAIAALQSLLDQYGQDLLAEYALLDLAKIQETALHDAAKAEAALRAFEKRFPLSSLAAKSLVELARLMTEQNKFEDAILTYRTAIKKYPKSDEVMSSNVGIGDVYAKSGEKDKARIQYEAARAMAQDWHDNKYGVDVGKQAWLQGILDYLRTQTTGK